MTGVMTMKISLKSAVVVALFAVLAAAPAAAQTGTMDVAYQWTAPTTGSVVQHYVVEHSVDGGAWTQVAASVTGNSYTLAAVTGVSHRIRVAGVDAQGRQGPFSLPSDAYTPDAGAPGQPGKPIIF
ncbi:MAG: fibronectin type III domain-containing protein [Krumholzibacteria bacterium]|nr:fibronectin type III domain-containing protein [Candidatus Krumholzibacteria bacterium]